MLSFTWWMLSSTSCSLPDLRLPAPSRLLLLLLKVIAEKLQRGVGMMDAPLCLLLHLQMEQQAGRQAGPFWISPGLLRFELLMEDYSHSFSLSSSLSLHASLLIITLILVLFLSSALPC